MPPRRRTAVPPIDVEDLRSRLAQGKIVRVAIAQSAQFPPGSIGRVRRIGDPEVEGEEFIHVELIVNGAKDLLPFAPGDLTPPARGAAVARPGRPVRSARPGGSDVPASSAVTPGPVPTAEHATVTRPIEPPLAEGVSSAALNGAPAATADSGPTAEPSSALGPEMGQAPPRPRVARAKPATKRRGPAVAISVGTTDSDPPQWRLEARIGSKVVVRNGSVSPARVWELVGMLDDEALSRAVGAVLDEQRRAAQSRADALAAELARVQAELAELPAPSDE